MHVEGCNAERVIASPDCGDCLPCQQSVNGPFKVPEAVIIDCHLDAPLHVVLIEAISQVVHVSSMPPKAGKDDLKYRNVVRKICALMCVQMLNGWVSNIFRMHFKNMDTPNELATCLSSQVAAACLQNH